MILKKIFGLEEKYDFSKEPLYDRFLVLIIFMLLAIGLIVVYTSSISVASLKYQDSLYFVKRQIAYLVMGGFSGFILVNLPFKFISKIGDLKFLLLALLLCIGTILLGTEINGAKRWLNLGLINLQSAELFKFIWIMFIAGYIDRHKDSLRSPWEQVKPFIILLMALAVIGYLQKDLGTALILCAVTFMLLFLAGMKYLHLSFMVLTMCALAGIAVLIHPYRILRLLAFTNPWEHQFDYGYQTTMSLMSFGRGEIYGEGLGNSIFKLAYLPDSHTDFVSAIWAEETGLIGIGIILLLEFCLVARLFALGIMCLRSETNRNLKQFGVCVGVGVWFLMQVFINIGTATSLTPAKGLTLPLISYGGSSLIMMILALTVVIRISYERRYGVLKTLEANKIVDNLYSRNKRNQNSEERLNEQPKAIKKRVRNKTQDISDDNVTVEKKVKKTISRKKVKANGNEDQAKLDDHTLSDEISDIHLEK